MCYRKTDFLVTDLIKAFHLRQIIHYNLSFSLSNNVQAPKRALASAMVAMGTTLGTTVDG